MTAAAGNWLLLHADSVAGNGEWTAYEWWPCEGRDLEPHDDFAAMVTRPGLGRWRNRNPPLNWMGRVLAGAGTEDCRLPRSAQP
jgi:hypothetical protein